MQKFVIGLFLMSFMTCQSKKTMSQSASQAKIYGKWQLVSITEKNTGKKQDFSDKSFFATFTQDGRLQYNLDVNGCEGKFSLVGKGEIQMNATDFVCTQACCDTVRINYVAVKRYEIQGKTLKLFSENEILEMKAL
ncbi:MULTISPECIES: META domain-containing protein [Raineya]|jgi:hypothetical protein|uniref:Lipocalin-like domain n=1 Tax=Raineya orbicola TaxID=2016530 RepID=A0A2N3IDI5_9BACT|nr:META domain-containing protein [Raineya orbicola]PKQ68335.1 Lipocalin-like domain [Raineya orbicola]